MSAQPNARNFLLQLAADGIAPVIGGCAGAILGGPDGAVGGAVFGRVVEKAINYFGPGIVEKWLGGLRRRPKNEQVEAVAELGMLSVEQARQDNTCRAQLSSASTPRCLRC